MTENSEGRFFLPSFSFCSRDKWGGSHPPPVSKTGKDVGRGNRDTRLDGFAASVYDSLIINFTQMTELTKEYFDKAISGLVTKTDAAATEKRILKRIDEAQEELARIVAETIAEPFSSRFDRLEELLTVKDEVQTLKRQMVEIRSALHLTGN